MPDENMSMQEVTKAFGTKSNFKVIREDFDKCLDHVIHLIDDAAFLYKKGSFSDFDSQCDRYDKS